MRIIRFGVVVGVVLLGLCLRTQASNESTDVSLVNLIAAPEKYDGKQVRVIGFLRLEFEGNALYLHQEDYQHAISKNAIWVDTTPGMMKNRVQLDRKYVLLEGRFDAKHFGHLGLFSGEIHQIKRVEPWRSDGAGRNPAAANQLGTQ